MVDALLDPWATGIAQRALLEVVLVGAAGGALGAWIVLYNLSYSAESLAHAMLPGLVLAALAGLPLLLGAGAGLLAAALAVAAAARVPTLDRDTAVAMEVTPLAGLGALLALSPATPAGLGGLLFGDPLGVTTGDLLAAAGLVVVLLGALTALHGRLLAVGFDRQGARALGLRPGRVDAALLALIALALLVAVQGLGNLLVVAVLIAPAAAARRLTRRMPAMIAVAAGLAALGGVAGLSLSHYAGTAAGASIAAVLVALFALTAAVRRA